MLSGRMMGRLRELGPRQSMKVETQLLAHKGTDPMFSTFPVVWG